MKEIEEKKEKNTCLNINVCERVDYMFVFNYQRESWKSATMDQHIKHAPFGLADHN